MRTCLAPGCTRETPAPRLVCAKHCAQLSTRIQAAVRMQLTSGNHDSARRILGDFYEENRTA